MSRELLQKAHEVVDIARGAGAQGVRAYVSRSRDSEVNWRDGKLDRISESTTMGVGIDMYVDGRFSSYGTSDLRREALKQFIEEAVASTRHLAQDPHRKLPDPEFYADRFKGDLDLVDAGGKASITGVGRRRTAQSVEEAMRACPGADLIISVESYCGDGEAEDALVTSNGMEGTSANTSYAISTQVTIRDKGEQRRADYWSTFSLHRDRLASVEDVARKALARAVEAIGAGPAKSGTYPFVVENRVASRLIGSILEAVNGQAVQQQRSYLAGKLDQQIASPLLTIHDEPQLPGAPGSRIYDGEGMTARRFPLVEKGMLRNFYLNTYNASKLSMRPTTGGSSNLVYELGAKDVDGLVAAMGNGILITDFVGGNSNSTTGDYSYGIHGHWIENGRRVRPLAEMNLSGNALETWMKLLEVGNDPWMNSSNRRPSLRFDALSFSGA